MSPETDKRFEEETQLYQPRTFILGLGKDHRKPCLSISTNKQVFNWGTLLCLSCSITRSSLWKPTPQVSTLRPLQCSCSFGYECNELANQSKGSLLPSSFLGWLGEENSFSFSFFSDTRSTSESRHDRYPPYGCKQIEVILAKHSWSRHCRGRIQILALHPGMWFCLGPSEGSNPIFACWGFLSLKIALRNIINKRSSHCHVMAGMWIQSFWAHCLSHLISKHLISN